MVNQDRNDRSKSNSLNNSKEERNCSSAEDKRKMEKIPNYKGKSRDKHFKQNNSSTQIDDNEFAGTLPKISNKKNSKGSTDNIFSERNNTNRGNNNIFYNNNTSANVKTRKSRKLVEENGSDSEIKNNKKIVEIDDDEDKELQKPKITKVLRKVGENVKKDKDDKKDKE